MYGFIKRVFIGLLSVCILIRFGRPLASNYKQPIKCVSLTNRPCQTRSTLFNVNSNETLFNETRLTLVNVNSNETVFYPFTVCVNKCFG